MIANSVELIEWKKLLKLLYIVLACSTYEGPYDHLCRRGALLGTMGRLESVRRSPITLLRQLGVSTVGGSMWQMGETCVLTFSAEVPVR